MTSLIGNIESFFILPTIRAINVVKVAGDVCEEKKRKRGLLVEQIALWNSIQCVCIGFVCNSR